MEGLCCCPHECWYNHGITPGLGHGVKGNGTSQRALGIILQNKEWRCSSAFLYLHHVRSVVPGPCYTRHCIWALSQREMHSSLQKRMKWYTSLQGGLSGDQSGFGSKKKKKLNCLAKHIVIWFSTKSILLATSEKFNSAFFVCWSLFLTAIHKFCWNHNCSADPYLGIQLEVSIVIFDWIQNLSFLHVNILWPSPHFSSALK